MCWLLTVEIKDSQEKRVTRKDVGELTHRRFGVAAAAGSLEAAEDIRHHMEVVGMLVEAAEDNNLLVVLVDLDKVSWVRYSQAKSGFKRTTLRRVVLLLLTAVVIFRRHEWL